MFTLRENWFIIRPSRGTFHLSEGNMMELFEQAVKNAGFTSVDHFLNHKRKPSRIAELMENPAFNPHRSIEKTSLFSMLPEDMKAEISGMPTEELKVICAGYLANDLPEVVALLP